MREATLNLFYEEPDPDRWLPGDRYPRRVIRRLIRHKPRIGGQRRVFLNLCAGLEKLGVNYRINDYRHIKRHPEELACIIGKSQVLDRIVWRNPLLVGPSLTVHPVYDPNLLKRLPVQKVLVPGEWLRKMFEPYYASAVVTWPVGIDTELWKPANIGSREKESETVKSDFLIYDKVMWDHQKYEVSLLQPVRNELKNRGLSFAEIRYGFYKEEEFRQVLKRCTAMVFLCEHETQGIAYQQALSCGVPILAWDRGGFWRDPAFYPHKVKFRPVSSVPYWDQRCGMKFKHAKDFPLAIEEFWAKVQARGFAPRDYILENLTLEKCARDYMRIAEVIKI
jgi:glycosyltransferase involved in cell wall biosynthesis